MMLTKRRKHPGRMVVAGDGQNIKTAHTHRQIPVTYMWIQLANCRITQKWTTHHKLSPPKKTYWWIQMCKMAKGHIIKHLPRDMEQNQGDKIGSKLLYVNTKNLIV